MGDWYEGNLEYSVSNGEVTVVKYWRAWNWTLRVTPYLVPNTIDGHPVTKIADYAYQEAFDLAEVIIPDNVTSVGAGAFRDCYNLKSISLGANLTSIGDEAFDGTAISTISFPSSLRTIGVHAFSGLSTLTRVRIPRDIEVKDYAFQLCSNLVVVVAPNVRYTPSSFYNVKSVVYVTPELIDELAYDLTNDSSFMNTLANNDAFVTAVANKILAASNNYGLATKTEVGGAVTMGVQRVLSAPSDYNLFTTQQVQSERTAGQNDVLSAPNSFSLYTTNQIHNLGLGGIVLNRNTNNQLVLNYQVLQSSDLQNWSAYQNNELVISNAPSDKMFLRVQAVEVAPQINALSTPTTKENGQSGQYEGEGNPGYGPSPEPLPENSDGGGKSPSPIAAP